MWKCGSKEVDDQHSVFSFFEVQYANDSGAGLCVVVVRLMAIFSVKLISQSTGQSGTHQLAVVCKMQTIPGSSVISDPVVRLKYGIIDRHLDIDVVNFDSLHMPACVFSSLNNPNQESSRNFEECIYYQIPSSRIVVTTAVSSIEEMLENTDDSTLLNPDLLNEELRLLNDKSELLNDKSELLNDKSDSLEDSSSGNKCFNSSDNESNDSDS